MGKPSLIDEIRRPRNIKDRAADRVAKTIGSWQFVLIQTCLVLTWVLINTLWGGAWDKYPFVLMNVLLSLQAAYTAPMIMMSQNRQGNIDRIDAQLDYENNRITNRGVHEVLERLEENAREIEELKRLLSEGVGLSTGTGENAVRQPSIKCIPPPRDEGEFGESELG